MGTGGSLFFASILVNIWAFSAAMSATVWAGEGDWYRSRFTYRLRCDRSTHMRMSSVPFFGATTMGAHHSVGYDTGVIMPCSSKLWSSAFSFSLYAYGMVLGVLTQNGLASSMRAT